MTPEEQIKEIDEALLYGNRALSLLQNAEGFLHNARKWGRFDIFGGKTVISLTKHANLEDAQRYLQMAQSELDSFRKKAKYIRININYAVKCSNSFMASDIYFDNLFSDYEMQGHIKQSIARVRDTIAQISEVIADLNNKKKELEN